MGKRAAIIVLVMVGIIGGSFGLRSTAQDVPPFIRPEQRQIEINRRPGLRTFTVPEMVPPPTASRPYPDLPPRYLSLDEAIQIALLNAEVIRVLTGVTASSSGRTIYDVSATNTTIDQAQGRFDPNLSLNNIFNQTDSPGATFDLLNPGFATLFGTQNENYSIDFAISKVNSWGGTSQMSVNSNPTYAEFGLARPLLNPVDRSNVEFRFTQPLLQGGGLRANQVPILVARINTERSFFQYKDSVQELVRGVVEAYWALVFARTDLWARENQVEQSRYALDVIRGRRLAEFGPDNLADEAQAEVAYYNFRATLLSSQANVLQREEALRNILRLPPTDGYRLVPVTPPRRDLVVPDWNRMVMLAEENRPDIIELKLILDADRQQLLQARNQAQPRLDAVAAYRWNGLEGVRLDGSRFESTPGQFTDWTLGVNFSVPLGLRQSRAVVRQQELLIARDRANLEQGIHQMINLLSLSYRNNDLFYSQYELYRQTREAARKNLEAQFFRYDAGLNRIFLDVLQAITSWGNSVSAEAQALTQYNTQLATLERQTGTILEAHGIRFFEERDGFVGPLLTEAYYSTRLLPSDNDWRYPAGDQPSEENFDLQVPNFTRRRGERVDPGIPNLDPNENLNPNGQSPLLPRPLDLIPPNDQPPPIDDSSMRMEPIFSQTSYFDRQRDPTIDRASSSRRLPMSARR